MSDITASFSRPIVIRAEVSERGKAGVATHSVRAAIINAAGESLDFGGDRLFKTSGWTTQYATLAAVTGYDGLYQVTEDPWDWGAADRPTTATEYTVRVEITAPATLISRHSLSLLVAPALPGDTLDETIDATGDDALGWQWVRTTQSGREVDRFDLFDFGGSRITGAPSSSNPDLIRTRTLS